MADNVLTIEQYLNGIVRNISVPANAVSTIILNVGCTTVEESHQILNTSTGEVMTVTSAQKVTKDTDVSLLTPRERELCQAWLYVWIAGSPTQTGTTRDADADWEHTEGGERMSANVLKQYLAMANEIFDKYDMPIVGEEDWGFVGRGIRNPQRRW